MRTLTRAALSLLLLGVSISAYANASRLGPQAVIEDSAASLLRAFDEGTIQTADPLQLQAIVGELLDEHVDFPSVSRLVLGKHWQTASSPQRQQFMTEFRALLVRTYSKMLTQSQRPRLRVLGEAISREGRLARVRAELDFNDGSPPLAVAYRMRQTDAGWKIIDVNISGFSLVTNYRSFFRRELRTKELPQVIDRLSAFNREQNGAPLERAG